MNAPPLLLALRFVAALGVLAVGPVLLWDGLARAGVMPPPSGEAQWLERSMHVRVLACAAVVAFAAWQRPGVPWRPARPGFVAARYAGFAVVWIAFVVGYLAVARAGDVVVPPQRELEHLANAAPGRVGWWLFAAGPVLAAPIAEEIVFRGYLQPALLAVLRPAWAIAIAAALFGAVHTLPYALPTAALGGFFGWLAYRCAALWPAVLAHALHNGLMVAIVILWPETLELFPR